MGLRIARPAAPRRRPGLGPSDLLQDPDDVRPATGPGAGFQAGVELTLQVPTGDFLD